MKKKFRLLFLLLLLLPAVLKLHAQTALVCNDLVQISLDSTCMHTVIAPEVLEGTYTVPTEDWPVQIDKVAPLGNGPWVPAVLSSADYGKTYQVRVTEPSSGNKCWGNIKVAEKLDCKRLTVVNLSGGQAVSLTSEDLNIGLTGDCPELGAVNATLDGNDTLTYDCNDLGVHLVTFAASNTGVSPGTCTTTVVVDDPQSECTSCVTCPPAQVVSLGVGAVQLVNAYNSGETAIFDQFGSMAFDLSACPTVEDTVYTITYETSPYGYNWFVRRWQGMEGAAVVASCEQIITFPAERTFHLSGTIYFDSIPNCQYDASEPTTSLFGVRITRLPSNVTFSIPSTATYDQTLTLNGQDTAIQVQVILPSNWTSNCPNTYYISSSDPSTEHVVNFGLQTTTLCPNLQVDMGMTILRRCFNNVIRVRYCNNGFVAQPNSYVEVKLDPLYVFQDANVSWTDLGNNTYHFMLGTIPPLSCDYFYIVAKLSCDAELGQTVCNTATIFPPDSCNTETWLGPVVETNAFCVGDSVYLAISNTGLANMAQPESYIVIEDVILYRNGTFQLDAGDSITIKMPANGATWRIEADQVENYPVLSIPASSIEGCAGLINTPGLINSFPENDNRDNFDRDCNVVVGSYDPNDKAAIPTGYGDKNYLRANTDLNYKIRFQNTGTDTAFRVVIIDTLSQYLNWSTLRAGASSHPYRLNVYPGGILHFVFDPIALPDSNVNEPASNGFVQFQISQKPDLPDGIVIENTASIYFDFNEAVVTNTVWHTLGAPYVVVDVDNPEAFGARVQARPNPFDTQTILDIQGVSPLQQGTFELTDALGRTLRTLQFSGSQLTLDRGHLPSGVYAFSIRENGRLISSGRLIVQ